MFEIKSIRQKIIDTAKLNNLRHSIAGKQNRPSPGDGSRAPNSAGFAGENTMRIAGDGSVQHGVKYGDDWYYRTYTQSGRDDWDIEELIGVEKITSKIFSQNLYSGAGWGITKDDLGRFTLEIDNAIIRKKMLIWEIVINQLRASNGTFIVGSSAKIAEDDTGVERISDDAYNFTFESESGTSITQPFVPGDIICSRRFWYKDQNSTTPLGASTQQIVATVNDITVSGRSTSTIRVTIDRANSFGDPPSGGMEFIRVASSNVKRRGLIVFSADGNETTLNPNAVEVPFIDVYDSLETFQNFLDALGGDTNFIKVRLGRLDTLTGNTDEFGLWASTVHLVGSAVEGANRITIGTRAEFDAYDTSICRDGDLYVVTDEANNVYTWDAGTSAWVDRTNEWILDHRSTFLDMSTDTKIDYFEYRTTLHFWNNDIAEQYANIVAEALVFGANSTRFETAYSDLDTYLWTTLNLQTLFEAQNAWNLFSYTVAVVRATWNANWQEFYSSYAELKKLIQDAIDDYMPVDNDGKLKNTPGTGTPGLYLGSVNMGYHDGGVNWLTYMDNTGNFYLGGTGGKLRWNSSTNSLIIAGSITIENASTTDLSDFNNDSGWEANVGDEYTTNQDRLTLSQMRANTPDTPTGTGFFMSATHLGYYTGGAWKTFMHSTGDFYLGGTSGALRWDAGLNTLYVAGQIVFGTGSDADWSYISGSGKPDDNADVTLSAVEGELQVTGGGINLVLAGGNDGAIRSGQTAYGVGTGFWLGTVATVPKFSIGTTSDFMKFDGTDLITSGEVIVRSGDIYDDFILTATGRIQTIGKGSPLDATDGVFLGYWSGGTAQVFACGDATKYLYYNASTGNLLMAGGDLTAGTIIGSTIKTATSGDRVEMIPTGLKIYDYTGGFAGQLQFYKSTTQIGQLGVSASALYISVGATYDITISASADLDLLFGDNIKLSTLPASDAGLSTGNLYTQTAGQLVAGGSSDKVVCIV